MSALMQPVTTTTLALGKYTVLIMLLFQIGCQSPDVPRNVAFLDSGDECSIPCWLGITPGESSADEAVSQLKFNHIIDSNPLPTDGDYLRFEVQKAIGQLYLQDQSVSAIGFNPWAEITVDDLINLVGNPEAVGIARIGVPHICYAATFFYFSRGVAARAETCLEDKKTDVYEEGGVYSEMPISDILYVPIAEDVDELLMYLQGIGAYRLFPERAVSDWQGYAIYPLDK